MFAIVLTIFALPVLLKKLDCTLSPLEIGDGNIACGFVSETRGAARVKSANDDEDPKEDQSLNKCVSEQAVSRTEQSIDIGMDEEVIENPEGESVDTSMEDSNEPELFKIDEASRQRSETNGTGDPTGPEPGEASSREGGNTRRTSSRVASLRAAFEQPNAHAEGAKGRFHNGDRPNQKSMEMGKDYEAEIGRLKDELEKESEMRIAYEDKVTSLEEEVEELNSNFEEQAEAWREKYERRSQQERSEAEGRLNEMANKLKSHQMEVATLQGKLSELKRSVSISTRPSAQVSDATFMEEIGLLQHEVQNWVVNNFRRVKIEAPSDELCCRLDRVAEPKHFERLKPIYEGFDSAMKLPIVQATIMAYLLDIFVEPYLFGLPNDLRWVERPREAAEALPSVLTSAVYNRWRAMTFDALRQCDSAKELVQGAAHGMAEKINLTLNSVAELEADETKTISLKTIIKRAIDLAHLMRVQHAQYDFILPAPGDRFEPISMNDISEDSDIDAERTVRCATFVSIFKIGDENGEHIESKTLIAKAKVLCDDSEPRNT